MRRQTLNIFSMSFLDLLSCALGSVILLMVIFTVMMYGQREDHRVFLFSADFELTMATDLPAARSGIGAELASKAFLTESYDPTDYFELLLFDESGHRYTPHVTTSAVRSTDAQSGGEVYRASATLSLKRPLMGRWSLHLSPTGDRAENEVKGAQGAGEQSLMDELRESTPEWKQYVDLTSGESFKTPRDLEEEITRGIKKQQRGQASKASDLWWLMTQVRMLCPRDVRVLANVPSLARIVDAIAPSLADDSVPLDLYLKNLVENENRIRRLIQDRSMLAARAQVAAMWLEISNALLRAKAMPLIGRRVRDRQITTSLYMLGVHVLHLRHGLEGSLSGLNRNNDELAVASLLRVDDPRGLMTPIPEFLRHLQLHEFSARVPMGREEEPGEEALFRIEVDPNETDWPGGMLIFEEDRNEAGERGFPIVLRDALERTLEVAAAKPKRTDIIRAWDVSEVRDRMNPLLFLVLSTLQGSKWQERDPRKAKSLLSFEGEPRWFERMNACLQTAIDSGEARNMGFPAVFVLGHYGTNIPAQLRPACREIIAKIDVAEMEDGIRHAKRFQPNLFFGALEGAIGSARFRLTVDPIMIHWGSDIEQKTFELLNETLSDRRAILTFDLYPDEVAIFERTK